MTRIMANDGISMYVRIETALRAFDVLRVCILIPSS